MIRRPPRSTLFSLHDALPICGGPQPENPALAGHSRADTPERRPADRVRGRRRQQTRDAGGSDRGVANLRSEEHTSELQSRLHLVCRLLLEKKKKKYTPAQSRP